MDSKEFENRHNKTSTVLKILGIIILPIGLACEIIGLVDFFGAMGSFDPPKYFFMCFIGMPLIAAGTFCLIFGFQRKIVEYNATQVAPVAKDFTNYVVDGTSETIANVAGKVMSQINKSKDTPVEGVNCNTCSKCGFVNPADSQFCSKCGSPLLKKCPYCGTVNDDGSNYCKSCGKSIL